MADGGSIARCPKFCFVVDPRHRQIMHRMPRWIRMLYFNALDVNKECRFCVEHTMYDLYIWKITRMASQTAKWMVDFYLKWICDYSEELKQK